MIQNCKINHNASLPIISITVTLHFKSLFTAPPSLHRSAKRTSQKPPSIPARTVGLPLSPEEKFLATGVRAARGRQACGPDGTELGEERGEGE